MVNLDWVVQTNSVQYFQQQYRNKGAKKIVFFQNKKVGGGDVVFWCSEINLR